MGDVQKIQWVLPKILTWFKKNQRTGLPWRKKHRDPYAVWVSEIMLQQTQVSRVIPFYERFVERFPDVSTLAKANWQEFLPYYQGLGYYSRGRNMLKTAKMIADQYGGTFPREKAELLKLPGVGEYTANAILSFAFGEPVLTFDTNHQRVWGRLLHGDKRAKVHQQLIEEQFIAGGYSSVQINEALMDFANTVCLNTSPQCEICPLRQQCQYYAENGKREVSTRSSKQPFPRKSARVLLILHADNQRFFSAGQKSFRPFELSEKHNTRSGIKQYFADKYGLKLSVRPPFKKLILKGKPTMLVRAQILLGEHQFSVFAREEYRRWLQSVA